jgi:hypothetical protein
MVGLHHCAIALLELLPLVSCGFFCKGANAVEGPPREQLEDVSAARERSLAFWPCSTCKKLLLEVLAVLPRRCPTMGRVVIRVSISAGERSFCYVQFGLRLASFLLKDA